MLADLVVLDRNPFKIPIAQVVDERDDDADQWGDGVSARQRLHPGPFTSDDVWN